MAPNVSFFKQLFLRLPLTGKTIIVNSAVHNYGFWFLSKTVELIGFTMMSCFLGSEESRETTVCTVTLDCEWRESCFDFSTIFRFFFSVKKCFDIYTHTHFLEIKCFLEWTKLVKTLYNWQYKYNEYFVLTCIKYKAGDSK